MTAHPVLLQKKYTRIVSILAERLNVSLIQALEVFYHSRMYTLISEGVSDLHCRSDLYLSDEIMDEQTDAVNASRGDGVCRTADGNCGAAGGAAR